MKALHFTRSRPTGREVRTLIPSMSACIFSHQGQRRTAYLGCVTTYAIRLMQAGWSPTTSLR